MSSSRLDDLLELLADQHRRHIIYALTQSSDGTMDVDTLIDEILQDGRRDGQRDQLLIQLHHNHLPKLRGLGVIEYDPETSLVRYTPDQQFEAIVNGIAANGILLAPDK